jgi:magnesium transporter
MGKAKKRRSSIKYADDSTESVKLLLKLRLPWLILGLVLGAGLAVLVSKFEAKLAENVRLAFFIPFIVYLSDAVGAQTEGIYIRNLKKRRNPFHVYLVKEATIGLVLGLLFGSATWIFASVWLGDAQIAATVALAMFFNVMLAPILGVVIPTLIKREHQDPALGAGPFVTVVQDGVSLAIYFLIASLIIL